VESRQLSPIIPRAGTLGRSAGSASAAGVCLPQLSSHVIRAKEKCIFISLRFFDLLPNCLKVTPVPVKRSLLSHRHVSASTAFANHLPVAPLASARLTLDRIFKFTSYLSSHVTFPSHPCLHDLPLMLSIQLLPWNTIPIISHR
jgi:hypothetical protein